MKRALDGSWSGGAVVVASLKGIAKSRCTTVAGGVECKVREAMIFADRLPPGPARGTEESR